MYEVEIGESRFLDREVVSKFTSLINDGQSAASLCGHSIRSQNALLGSLQIGKRVQSISSRELLI